MPSILSSIEGPPSSIQDPWDWTVDQVVFALTDHDSPLLQSNPSLSLPNPDILANVLRGNDVNGHALLTEINTQCLRDDLGIKSLSHRAAINHLISQLKNKSSKFFEEQVQQVQRSDRVSSVGMGSRIGSPFFASRFSFESRAASRVPGMMVSPTSASAQSQNGFGLGESPQLRSVLAEGPRLQQADPPTMIPLRSLNEMQNAGGFGINMSEGRLDVAKPEKSTNPDTMASGHNEPPTRDKMNTSDTEQAARHGRQGETTIVDETGKERRRLMIARPGTLEPIQTIAAASPAFNEPLSSPEALRKDTNADPSFELNISPTSDCPALGDELSRDTRVHPTPVEAATSVLGSALGLLDAPADPGLVLIDANGRKRMRPFLVAEANFDLEDQQSPKSIPKNVRGTFGSSARDLREVELTDRVQQLSYGKIARRKSDQLYLGFESWPIDTLVYGDVALGQDLDKDQAVVNKSQSGQPNESDDFSVVPNNDVGNGQRLYVNARMKYLLRSQRIPLERDGRAHIGIIPYPGMISKKHHSLSFTLYSSSSHGVIASRANRSMWMEDRVAPDATETDGMTGNIFNVADPALALDESNDTEWKALEKWKFMNGKDEVLPVYGDSDSEGEYDLETWREMEMERGHIARPLGRSTNAKLSSVEVQGAIDVAIEQIVLDWTLKRLPKLRHKEWRLWWKSRKDRNSKSQIESLTHDMEKLETRIASLRKEIAQEKWSKTSQVNKQSKIMQPSIFDREDCNWKIVTLKLHKPPDKPPLAARQPKPAKSPKAGEVLEDGEEILTANTEISASSEDDLEDFIVEDDADGDIYQPVIVDDDLTMADVEDGINSDTLIADEPKPKTPIKRVTQFSRAGPSPSSVIDLTQQSDPVEPELFAPKPEPTYAIHTPPLYGSENDSEMFQRSRSKRPVFRVPPTVPKSPTKNTEIISLDSDSNQSLDGPIINPSNCFPALDDINGIRKMNPVDLVERQDRKRLLIWMVARASVFQRQAAFGYLDKTGMEISRENVVTGLTELLHDKRRLKGMNSEDSDCVMRIASWRVCWTIPVKVTLSGLRTPHIIETLEDDDGYEPFYDFLFECLQYYQKVPSLPGQNSSKKRRELIVRGDSEEAVHHSQNPKRKYFVPESQESLDKRHAAQDRLRANEERRRQEELKYRLTGMSTDNTDTLKVVVNPGKLADQDFIHLNPKFGNGARIKPHQEEGLQFLWREITAEHEDLQGCLLAQTMGLGKTMQVIALLATLAEAAQSSKNIRNQVPPSLRESRTLILCPPALIENWWDECLLWPPQPRSENIGELRKVTSAMKQPDRLNEIHAWSKAGGILLLGFDTFRALIHNKPRHQRTGAKTKEKKAPLDDWQHERVKKALLERPTLVVADEAHQFKSKSSSLNLAMNQIETKSRIALTGSPLNNNLGEYHSLVDWIAPDYLGNSTEFKAYYEEPISQGLYQDSTESEYRISRTKLKALELSLEPKVHRADVSCLHAELNGKSEFVIKVPLTELQRELYHIYAENMRTASRGKEPGTATLWSWLAVLRLLCNHPKCYKKKLLEVESGSIGSKSALQQEKALTSVVEEALVGSEDDMAIIDEPDSRATLSKIRNESRKVFESLTEPIDALFFSHKTQVLISILRFSQDAHDKILVFSHSIPTLDYIGEQLLKTAQKYVRIDGMVDPQKRQSMTKVFNEGDINICLVSTRAGGQGLNLFGANRVVILDDHFNPMWEQQAIGRAYRIGQQKPVYVYRLTTGGTFEQAIQNQALFKEQLATRVVDKKNPNRRALKGAGQYLFPPKAVDQEDLNQFLGKDSLVLDRLLAAQTENKILSITPSETFHIEDGIELTPAERMEAEQMQKDGNLRRRDPKAHTARILARKDRDIRPFQQDPPSNHLPPAAFVAPMTSTQPVRWDTPMIATGDMLCTPSTAPDAASDTGRVLVRPSAANTSAAITTHLDRPRPGPLPYSDLKAGKSASVPAQEQTRPSLDATRRLSATPEFTSHDLQKHIEQSVTSLNNNQGPQLEEALAEAIGDLFRPNELSVLDPSAERMKMLCPKASAIRKATREDFLAVISKKGLRNKHIAIPESALSLYAIVLRDLISKTTTDEDEYRRLAAGLKTLLERDEVEPQTLLKVLRQKGLLKDSITSAEVTVDSKARSDTSVICQYGSSHMAETIKKKHTSVSGQSGNSPLAETIRKKHESKENKGARKRGRSADEEHGNKKAKRAPVATPNFASSGKMKKTFNDLLTREAARPSRGGSRA